MEKKKTIRFASLLLVFVMATSSLLGGTLAKYTSSATGNDIATVARWEVELNGTDVEDLTEEQKTATFNLFDTIKDSNGVDNETDVATDLIAPGTSGAFALELTNNSEVNANGSLTFTLTRPEGVNIDFTTGLPAGYTPVEYIESTGGQYIDTGVKGSSNLRVLIDVFYDSSNVYGAIFGSREEDGRSNRFAVYPGGDYMGSQYATGQVSKFDKSIFWGNRVTIDKNKNVTTVAGESMSIRSAEFTSSFNLHLFGLNHGGTAGTFSKSKIYSCKIWDNDVLVRDYIPCLAPDGRPGLYDVVSGDFFGNAGSGTFKTGPVSGLTETAADQYTISVPLVRGETKEVAFDWLWAYEEGETADAIAANDTMETAAGIAARENEDLEVTVDITAVFEQVD